MTELVSTTLFVVDWVGITDVTGTDVGVTTVFVIAVVCGGDTGNVCANFVAATLAVPVAFTVIVFVGCDEVVGCAPLVVDCPFCWCFFLFEAKTIKNIITIKKIVFFYKFQIILLSKFKPVLCVF